MSRTVFGRAACAFAASLVVLTATGQVAASELKVVATIKPVHSLVAAVMDGVGSPRLLIEGTASPHTFSLKPSDAKALNDAQVIFRVSEGLEPYSAKLARALPKSVRLVSLEQVAGLKLYNLRTGANFELHDHGEGRHKHGHGHGHDHGHGKAARDSHVWLDPGNARLMAAQIAETLVALAPAHAARLRANAAALGERLDALAPELEAKLKPLAGRPYIVFHDAYQYFERRFGLAPVGSVTVSPDVPPSAKRLTDLRRKVTGLKATCVFAEPQFEPRIIDTIVEGTSARRGVLDPLGAAIEPGAEHYFKLLRALASDLTACLANPS